LIFSIPIKSVITIYEAKAKQKNLSFSCALDKNIPRYLISDKERLLQILFNLLSNALKFTEKGKITINVSIKSKKLKDRKIEILFLVEDTGVGIPKNQQKEIFKIFTQADESISRKHGGMGVGLSIASSLVKLLEGKISIESKVNKGSKFYFTISAEISDEKIMAPKPKKEEMHKLKATRKKRLNILLAEDDMINAMITRIHLEKMKHRVTHAKNGKLALEYFKKNKFDLILMDVEMPEINGIKATQIIRNENKTTKSNIPIIAVTAHVVDEIKQECEKAGMNDFLTKPLNIKKLEETLLKYQ